jgi:pimeloyl-ACP methyl ester carboxylesterase
MTQFAIDNISVTGDLADNRVYSAGSGQPVVFLHGPFGQEWTSFLDALAKQYRVISPEIPGADNQTDLEVLINQWDLLVYYDELFDKLGLESFDLVGHSFGGMIAAEYAAAFRHRVRRLVLIDPMGLWIDEYPVGDFVNGDPADLSSRMWAHGSGAEKDHFKIRTDIDQDEAVEEVLRNMFSVAAAANYAHPIPDRGLKRRLHRITAPTQLIWGEKDGFVAPVYADKFASLIPNARLDMIADAAH